MKLVVAALVAASLSSAAFAADAVPAAAPAATVTKFSTDTPIEQLAADPKASAVLDADFPNITKHPMYDSFKSMSLKEVAPMSGGKITDAQLAKAAADLAQVK